MPQRYVIVTMCTIVSSSPAVLSCFVVGLCSHLWKSACHWNSDVVALRPNQLILCCSGWNSWLPGSVGRFDNSNMHSYPVYLSRLGTSCLSRPCSRLHSIVPSRHMWTRYGLSFLISIHNNLGRSGLSNIKLKWYGVMRDHYMEVPLYGM